MRRFSLAGEYVWRSNRVCVGRVRRFSSGEGSVTVEPVMWFKFSDGSGTGLVFGWFLWMLQVQHGSS